MTIVFLVSECKFLESEDHIEVNDVSFHKPFVEKPVSAEDHNVYIYFPSTAGGGSQRLFRKVMAMLLMSSITSMGPLLHGSGHETAAVLLPGFAINW